MVWKYLSTETRLNGSCSRREMKPTSDGGDQARGGPFRGHAAHVAPLNPSRVSFADQQPLILVRGFINREIIGSFDQQLPIMFGRERGLQRRGQGIRIADRNHQS